MVLTAKKAADTVGMTKAGIIKAIHTGKLSAVKNVHGQWEIEPAELFRVYKPFTPSTANDNGQVDDGLQAKLTGLQAENAGLKALVEALQSERNDIRERLTAETDERRRLTLMIADQRQKGFLARLFGK